jgi:hypothetical protein
MRNILLFITIFTMVVLCGCSGSKLATVKVSGTVTLDGVPLDDATVTFTPKTEGQGHPAYGITDTNGRYQLQTFLGAVNAGTTPGDYLVSVTKREKSGGEGVSGSPSSGTGPPPPPKSLIPEKYGKTETSELTATVENKKNNVIDFDLTN